MASPTKPRILHRFLAWISLPPGVETEPRHASRSNTIARSYPSATTRAHPPRSNSIHSHSHPHSHSTTPSSKPTPTTTITTKTDNESSSSFVDLSKQYVDILNRGLTRQHTEDANYFQRRREIQDHYRAIVEYDRLRYMTELEKTNASLSFLNRQDELDREWEERLLLQEVRLERVQRRVGDRGIDGDGDGDRDGGRGRGRGGRVEVEAIANPLFCPELVGMGS